MWWDSVTHYLEQLPPLWERVEEVRALGSVVELELDALKSRCRQLCYNAYPQTADREGVERWEKILAITTPNRGDLDSRRRAILAILQTRPPVNIDTVTQIVGTYLGVPVEPRLRGLHLWLAYRGTTRLADLDPLYQLLNELLPANLTYEVSYAYVTWREVEDNRWRDLAGRSWQAVRMGEDIGFQGVYWEGLSQCSWESLETTDWETLSRTEEQAGGDV